MTHPVPIADVTRRLTERSAATRAAYLERVRAARPAGPGPRRPRLRQPRPRLRGRAAPTRTELQARGHAERRDRLQLQRHAVGPPAVRRVPGADQGGGPRRGRRSPSSRAACPPCATASPRAARAWSCRSTAATSSPWPPRSPCRTTCSTPRCMLGVCDKIVPGLADRRAVVRAPADAASCPPGPMTSGLSNALKSKVRQQYADGEIGRDELLAAEAAAYHGPGTCTFYGTANSNQMLMELMGLHLPGASFVNPGTPLRTALTEAAGARGAVELEHAGRRHRRRAGRRQRRGGAAGHRRLDQPHDAPGRHRQGRGHRPALGRLRRPVGRRAAAGPDLPQRQGRHQPLPRRGRHRVPGRASCSAPGLLHGDVQTVAGPGLDALHDRSRCSPTAS